jgi:outer membrane protein assembly factor BamB
MLSHHLSEDQLVGYIHQTLTDAEREEIDRHIAGCAQCRGMLSDHEAIQRRIAYGLASDLKKVHPPASMAFATVSPRLKRFGGVAALWLAVDRPLTAAVTLTLFTLLMVGVILLLTRTRLATPAGGVDGMMFRGNPQHTGVYQATFLPQRGELAWSFKTDGLTWTSPALADGLVYFSSNDYLYALDSQTGQTKWQRSLPYDASSPAVVDGVLYVSFGANMIALDSQTGQLKWKVSPGPHALCGSPTVAGGTVYSNSQDYLYALDSQTGITKWKFAHELSSSSSPAVADGTVYYGNIYLYALDSRSGALKWKFNTHGQIDSAPAVADGVVYVASYGGILDAVDGQTGQLKWEFQAAGATVSSPAVAGEIVYFGGDRAFYALDGRSGRVIWTFETGAKIESSPAIADDTVYFGSFDRYLYALDRFTGYEKWRFETGAAIKSSPAIADGQIYVSSMDQSFYAVR